MSLIQLESNKGKQISSIEKHELILLFFKNFLRQLILKIFQILFKNHVYPMILKQILN